MIQLKCHIMIQWKNNNASRIGLHPLGNRWIFTPGFMEEQNRIGKTLTFLSQGSGILAISSSDLQ